MFAVKRMSYFSPGYCKRATSNYCNCTKLLFFLFRNVFQNGVGDYTIVLPKLGSRWQNVLLWICRRSVHFDVLQNYISSALLFPSCMNWFFYLLCFLFCAFRGLVEDFQTAGSVLKVQQKCTFSHYRSFYSTISLCGEAPNHGVHGEPLGKALPCTDSGWHQSWRSGAGFAAGHPTTAASRKVSELLNTEHDTCSW